MFYLSMRHPACFSIRAGIRVTEMLKTKLKSIPVAAAINARLKSWSVEQSAAAIRRRYGEYVRDYGLAVPAGQALLRAVTTSSWPIR
jgi:hypothetical protein